MTCRPSEPSQPYSGPGVIVPLLGDGDREACPNFVAGVLRIRESAVNGRVAPNCDGGISVGPDVRLLGAAWSRVAEPNLAGQTITQHNISNTHITCHTSQCRPMRACAGGKQAPRAL